MVENEDPTSSEVFDDAARLPDPARADSTRSSFRPPIPLLVSGFTFLWVVLRVLVETRGDVTSALALMSSSGSVDVVLGVIVASFSMVVVATFFLLEILRHRASRLGHAKARGWLTYSQVMVATLALGYVPTGLLLLYGFFYGGARISKLRWMSPYSSTEELSTVTLVVLASTFIFTSLGQMWLPTEGLALRGQNGEKDDVVIGYVLDDREGWLTYLDDETRVVRRVRSQDLEHRIICSSRSDYWLWTSLTRLNNASDLPDCQDSPWQWRPRPRTGGQGEL